MSSKLRRYQRDRYLRGGALRGTNTAIRLIRQKVISGQFSVQKYTTKEDERLDHLAAKFLGDGRMWWVIAACSGIGWGLQVPPGITLSIPKHIDEIRAITG